MIGLYRICREWHINLITCIGTIIANILAESIPRIFDKKTYSRILDETFNSMIYFASFRQMAGEVVYSTPISIQEIIYYYTRLLTALDVP